MACSSYTIAGIAEACKDSIGGVKVIYIAKRESMKMSGTGGATVSNGVITPATADVANFKRYAVRRATSSATSTLQVSETAGNSWQTELNLQFMKQDATKRSEVMALAEEGLVVVFTDSNNNSWFLGYDYPVEASAATAESGTALSDLNGYNLTLQDNSVELPYSVDSAWMASLEASFVTA